MSANRWWSVMCARLRTLARRGQVESELERELRFHLDEQACENAERGMTDGEAREAARRRLGGVTQIAEECRDMRRTRLLEDTERDVRYAARGFLRTPGFYLAIVVTVALAIGANTAIFSVVDGVLLKPLSYTQPERMVRLFLDGAEYKKFPLNPYDFRDYRERAHSFASMAAYGRDDMQLSGTGEPARLAGFAVTAGFFRVLGIRPAMGRDFTESDEIPANGHVVVLGNQTWREHFGARRDALGQRMLLNGEPYTVVGVLPSGVVHPGNDYQPVAYGETIDVWVPFTFRTAVSERGSHFLNGIGRLKSGVRAARAQAELDGVMAALGKEYEADRGWRVRVTPLHTEIVGGAQRLLWILLGSVTLVLLIACVNAANLLLSRATVRERELALRGALGAARTRLLRQLLTESLLISLLGAALGGVVAVAGVRGLVALVPADFPRAADIQVNGTMFLFALGVALATGILFGLAPAWQGSKVDLKQSLHEGGRSATSSGRSLRLRDVLVVSEVGLACLLSIGAGLVLRSFVNLLHTDAGFRTEGVVTASVSLRSPHYPEAADVSRFYEQLTKDLNAKAGVSAAGMGSDLPWTGYNENTGGFKVEGKPLPPLGSDYHARYHWASADYFRALGIPLVGGRFFNPRDRESGARSLLINQAMAKRYWRGENAVGKRVSFEDHPQEKDWMTVVGVVGDVKDTPASDGPEPAFWWPVTEDPVRDMLVVVRSGARAETATAMLRKAVRELDPSLAVAEVRTMSEIADRAYASARFALLLIGLFAAVALLLAAIGTYGVMAYTMSRRTHEFGLRMALGAEPRDLLGFVMGQGMKLAVAGVLLGGLCGLVFGRLLATLLYQVKVYDPTTFIAACAVGLGAAGVACLAPGWRAMRSDPMMALRAD